MSDTISDILSNYSSSSPGVKSNIARLLNAGRLGGTGKLLILPVDQGIEHGPAKSFSTNTRAFDPFYHPYIALKAGLSGYAAPIGMMEVIADSYAYKIPLILKLNSSDSLYPKEFEGENQAITSSVKDAVRLGCAAVGFTIYPGSSKSFSMIEQARDVIREANLHGLPSIVWAYPRGAGIVRGHETAIDIIGYAVHIAATIGAHIIKTKIPSNKVADDSNDINCDINSTSSRIEYIMKCAFDKKRIVLFSGGASKDISLLKEEIIAIKAGGGNGSIIGRNTFQRPEEESIAMLEEIISIYGSYAT